MSDRLVRLEVHNFHSLANVNIELDALNVLFGPNGAGKSTFLDTIWFVRDCAIRGVDEAATERSHGIGALWDGADVGANIAIKLETDLAEYQISLGYSAGRIELFVGEILYSKELGRRLIDRKVGSDKADFYHYNIADTALVTLKEPETLALTRYLAFADNSPEAASVDGLLRFVHFYQARAADLYRLKKRGSESSYQTWLWDRCQNLWSVLRNLHDRQGVDERYDTIIGFMRESFPAFRDLLIEPTGPTTVYGSFLEKGRRSPIQASGVSDGHLQMLAHLTALFAEGQERRSLLMFDEPEASLHPYTLSVLAKAVKLATTEWNKQVFIATHSPVLISQFDPANILATEIGATGQTVIRRVSEMTEISDLLEEYAAGSLYMAEMLAAQSRPAFEEIPA